MNYREVLQKYWHYDDFRGIQREVIESIGSGRDTLALMPTGGGKSITFQVPAMAAQGLCIVITPLISLMKDQTEALRRLGIKAAYISSHMSHEQTLTVLDNAIFGAYKFLYISPERLASRLFLDKMSRMTACLIAVDEAHCICQWGYDFRPSYLQVAQIRDFFPQVPLLALTATATPAVADDIQQQLRFREKNLLSMSFERKNLAYIVRREDAIFDGLLRAIDETPGPCIVYARSRRKTRELAQQLSELGYTATHYHAGLHSMQKNENQNRWMTDEKRIMVATSAFGMGIDKPDVRLVVHVDIPDSIEAYFQEAGRAGRDGNPAKALLLTDGKERQVMARRLAQQFPNLDYVRQVYEHLCCFLGIAEGDGLGVHRELNLDTFCRVFGHYPTSLLGAIDLLSKAGYINYTDEDDTSSRLHVNVSRDELLRAVLPSEQNLVLCVLRWYGGIFTDYAYIDEDGLAREAGLTADATYKAFVRLSQRRLIDYIPRKHLPRVEFLCRRVDKEKVQIPHRVYEERRRRYEQRMEAMLRYADADATVCRSRMLLSYFGEDGAEACGICDVCMEKREGAAATDGAEALRERILCQLRERPRRAFELDVAGVDAGLLGRVVDEMRASGEIFLDGVLLRAR